MNLMTISFTLPILVWKEHFILSFNVNVLGANVVQKPFNYNLKHIFFYL